MAIHLIVIEIKSNQQNNQPNNTAINHAATLYKTNGQICYQEKWTHQWTFHLPQNVNFALKISYNLLGRSLYLIIHIHAPRRVNPLDLHNPVAFPIAP